MNLPLIARILLGLIFTVFGLNGFFDFMPAFEVPEAAGSFFGALIATGYLFPLLKLTETVCGVLLITNKMVPLALTMLAPVLLNIMMFHIFLAPGPAAMAVPVLATVLLLYLAYCYRSYFSGVLAVNAVPDEVREEVLA